MTTVEIRADEAIREFQRIGLAFHVTQILDVVGDRLLAWADQNFQSGGAETPWAPLRPNTIAGRRKGSSAPLQDTGRLRQSVTRKSVGDAVHIGYGVETAAWHHFGTSPYLIRPTKARALRFTTTEGVVFRRLVRHPGLPARRLLPSDALAGQLATAEVDALVERATRGAG